VSTISEAASAADRILACVGADSGGCALVHRAHALARTLDAPWTVLHVAAGSDARLDEGARDRIAEALRLAERLGAATVTLTGRTVADDIVGYAAENGVTQIVIGNPASPRWPAFWRRSIARTLVQRTRGIHLHLVATDALPSQRRARSGIAAGFDVRAHVMAAAIIAVALLAGVVIH
jgi:two-component system, OmpR family, sensor histidine kinase KdpD